MQEEHEAQGRPEQYYTIREAAQRFRVAESTVWRWVDKGRMPAYRLPGGRIRLRKADVETAVKPAEVDKAPGDGPGVKGMPKPEPIDWRMYAVLRGTPMPLEELMERSRRHREKMLARRGGKPLPSSVEDLRKAREEWGRRLDNV